MIEHRAVFTAVRDAIFLVDPATGMILDANPSAELLCGRSVPELRLLHYRQLQPQEATDGVKIPFEWIEHEDGSTEGRILHKDGRCTNVEIVASQLTGPNGRPVVVSVFRDITNRDDTREALRRSEERFAQVAESAGEFIWEVDADGLYLYASPAVEQILGYTPDELVGKMHTYDLLVPENREEVKRAALAIVARQEPFRSFLTWRVNKAGNVVALETSGMPYRDVEGLFLGYRGATRDVTEQKRAEEVLRQSEKIHRAIGESIDYGVWICAPDGRNVYASESFLKLVGLTQEQCSDFGWSSVLHPDDAHRTIEAWKECVRTEGRWDIEHRFRGRDGEWHPILARGVPVRDECGRITCWAGINLDISELKQMQESLVHSEREAHSRAEELQAIMDAAPAMILIAHDRECRHISGNRTAHTLLRQELNSNLSKSAAERERPSNFRVMRDGTEIPNAELPVQRAALTGQRVSNCEMEVVFDDNTYLSLLGNVEPLVDVNGHSRGAVAVMSNITERKRGEERLRASEAQLNHAQRLARIGSWERDLEADQNYWSDEMLRILGLTDDPPSTLEAFLTHVHPKDRQKLLNADFTINSNPGPVEIEYRIVRPDGEIRLVRTVAEGMRDDRGVFRVVGATQDVTDEVTARENLRQSESRLKNAERLARVGHWYWDLETNLVFWSEETFRIFGKNPDYTPSYEGLQEMILPSDKVRVDEWVRKCLAAKAGDSLEFQVRLRADDIRTIACVSEVIVSENGAPVCFAGSCQDITEHRRNQEMLRENEATTRALLDTAAQAILAVDGRGAIVLANRMALQMFGYRLEDLLGKQLEVLLPERLRLAHRERRTDYFSRPIMRPMGSSLELAGLRRDGSEFPIEVSLSSVCTSRGILAVSFVTDITVRRRADAALRNSEQQLRALAQNLLTAQEDERRRLSRELHDDVTQRLAFISIELGKLTGETSGLDPKAQAHIRTLQELTLEMSNEVRRISHGLHPSVIEDFGLSIALEGFCQEFGQAKAINVVFDGFVDDARLDPPGATCLYRVAQESLRNAVVHGHATDVRVELKEDDKSIQLRIRDNGIGFTAEEARGHTGLGLISMRERIQSFQGTLTTTSYTGQGTEVAASIPVAGGRRDLGLNSAS